MFENCVKIDGIEHANKYVAKPGTSEHQTGLAIDISIRRNNEILEATSEDDPEIKWLRRNSYKYGFILRFPKDKEKLTGYEYESWHYRYVGEKIATYIHDNNLCFEEYYTMFIEVFK